MKYLFVIPRMGCGGAERVLANQANVFSEKGHDVTIMTIVGGESFYKLSDSVKYKSAQVKVNRKNKIASVISQFIGFFKSFFYFRKIISENKPDAVFSQQREADILCYCVKKTGVQFKHICYEINDPFVRSKLTKRILRQIFNDSALLVCQSKKAAEFYNTAPNITVIPNPIDPDVIPLRTAVQNNKIVAVGRLDKQKNFIMLINSFNEVLKTHKQCKLDIYGEGPERSRLQALIDKLGLQNCVVLCGARSEVLKYICDAALFVMSSDYEGMPNALLEAMAIGMPVVSTDFATGVARDLIGKDNGMVVPVGDITAMANAIISILDDPVQQKIMGDNNRYCMQAFYNNKIMNQWIEAFERVTDAH